MLKSKSLLIDGMKHVFRHLVSVDVTPWIDNLGNHVHRVDIVATNPLNRRRNWKQFIIIGETMYLSIYGGQMEAAWMHSHNYSNKIIRVISHWLATTAENIMGFERQKVRTTILKSELISRTTV